ncbi:hypothetical protein SNE40_006127 [Patella caerulea]|uniref:Biogenesis of lysosome-related organelles complex 1 subunit 5 n=1 Tax=Patella caerulea TaxID=87958 RepID=A0AAN8K1W7_PATCE
MTTEHLFKDFSVLYSRLFDHHPVLQGNINLFVREFEDKRGDREIERLRFTSDSCNSINNHVIPDICQILEDNLKQISDKVSIATQMTLDLAESEEKVQRPYLMGQRARRKEEWTEFMSGQVARSSRVDQDYETQVQQLKENYNELETKLDNSLKPVL